MGKVVVPALGVALIGVLAWFLMLKPGGDETAAPAPPKAPVSEAMAPTSEAVALPKSAHPPVVHGALAARPAPKVVPETGMPALAAEAVPPAIEMPTATMAEMKDSVRTYYGNLPRTGKMPAKISLEEVLPAAVIAELGARPDAPIVMLGTRHVTEQVAFTEVLEMSPDFQQMMGVSWLEADGTERRNYVRLTVPEKPENP